MYTPQLCGNRLEMMWNTNRMSDSKTKRQKWKYKQGHLFIYLLWLKKCSINKIYTEFCYLFCLTTQSLSHTHRGEVGVPLCPADERWGGELNLWPFPLGKRPSGLQYHRADPLQPAWFGSSSACLSTPTAGT